jgi:uncharacterized protein (TIGR02246 family)
MRRILLVVAGVSLWSSFGYSQALFGTAADEAAIRQRRQAALEAWNKHDSQAMAKLWTPDVDQVRSNGTYHSGREGVEKSFTGTLAGVDQNSTIKEESSHIRFLTPDVALQDIVVVIADEKRVLREHSTIVYVKRGGVWMTTAIRTTPIR